ncbi:hypothetical protein HYFRA_00003426 [Hymenoscyphus fraxineus]|uniref:Gluconokinase n=1 Tax=Hymenoscyphus fraxineus TaxID=746836 RepID=A0A9N9PRL5_9HELO|nr:hypothetical protein HYFRA_00003426 [Hymenoscyphus fraxineus]
MIAVQSSQAQMPQQPIPTNSDHLTTTTSESLSVTNGATTNGNKPTKRHHIYMVGGTAACGKTTIAQYVADKLNLTYIEGDDFHSKENKEKMNQGIALTDGDRWDWLENLRTQSIDAINKNHTGVVITCSALRRRYRDVMRIAAYLHPDVDVHIVLLHAPFEVLQNRIAVRAKTTNHFFDPRLLESQFKTLERRQEDEWDVIEVDVSGEMEEVKREALEAMKKQTELKASNSTTSS